MIGSSGNEHTLSSTPHNAVRRLQLGLPTPPLSRPGEPPCSTSNSTRPEGEGDRGMLAWHSGRNQLVGPVDWRASKSTHSLAQHHVLLALRGVSNGWSLMLYIRPQRIPGGYEPQLCTMAPATEEWPARQHLHPIIACTRRASTVVRFASRPT
jgi:hypothetical protein